MQFLCLLALLPDPGPEALHNYSGSLSLVPCFKEVCGLYLQMVPEMTGSRMLEQMLHEGPGLGHPLLGAHNTQLPPAPVEVR